MVDFLPVVRVETEVPHLVEQLLGDFSTSAEDVHAVVNPAAAVRVSRLRLGELKIDSFSLVQSRSGGGES